MTYKNQPGIGIWRKRALLIYSLSRPPARPSVASAADSPAQHKPFVLVTIAATTSIGKDVPIALVRLCPFVE